MAHEISFSAALRVWLHISLLSFGGPAGQIALMHRILVEEKRWIGEERFLSALNFCTLLPGPEAQQLATYIGWLLHKTKGGLAAGLLFILPGMVAIMPLSLIYVLYGQLDMVGGFLFGIKAAVVAIVFQAVIRIGSRALGSLPKRIVAGAAFLALFLFNAPFPLIVIAAGLVGWLSACQGSTAFTAAGHTKTSGFSDAESALGAEIPAHAQPGGAKTLGIAFLLLCFWLIPIIALVALLGPDNRFSEIALFFGRMAVVTFGGAYAVLAYVGQAAVEQYQWLTTAEMLDGLGLAESTPGPLIMVTQFVGFLGGFREPGALSPLWGGALAGLLTTWVTFVPCFLWIFVGAPHIERLRHNAKLSSALAAVTAAVVGVILHLGLWFAAHYLFMRQQEAAMGPVTLSLPDFASINWPALGLTVIMLIALFRFRIGAIALIVSAGVAGLGLALLPG
jgi:chromate transporter